MKPKEFDELIRRKFDQDDFAYNPRNWDRLAEQLDGRAKKRSVIMWWLMPLAGVAASVALAMGVAPLMNQGLPGKAGVNTQVAKTLKVDGGRHAQGPAPQVTLLSANTDAPVANAAKHHNTYKNGKLAEENTDEEVHIDLLNAVPNSSTSKHKADIGLLNKEEVATVIKKEKKKEETADAMATFKPEAEKKVPKTSVILNGGYNQGSISNGYIAGATIRRMVSDKVYIESDIDFASSNNMQVIGSVHSYLAPAASSKIGSLSAGASSSTNNLPPVNLLTGPMINGGGLPGTQTNGGGVSGAPAAVGNTASARMAGGNPGNAPGAATSRNNMVSIQVTSNNFSGARTTGGHHSGAKTTGTTLTTGNSSNDKTNGPTLITDPRTTTNVPYNMNYLQITPSLGVKITRKFSIGAGADVQQALADNRPALDRTDVANPVQAPLFDLGLMGKTEYALTKKVKAGMCYRKGINGLFAADKYLERDYLQFQLKCIILNK